MSENTPDYDKQDTSSSEKVEKQSVMNEILEKMRHLSSEKDKITEQLLRTIRYSGQTNDKIMEVLVEQQKLNKAQHKHNKLKFLFYLTPVFLMLFYWANQAYKEQTKYQSPTGYVAQVAITGQIKPGSPTASADAVIPALRAAFEDTNAKGVLIKISSPGGSPAQAHLIYEEIKRLQALYPDTKMSLIGEDSLTSGAMWIAAAAPEINVLSSTYTGSIGVIVSQFNFGKAIKNYDVERLIITSGNNKSVLDTFTEPKDKDIEKIRTMAGQIHAQFKDVVMTSRGDRLKADPDYLFSGEFWLGKEAMELGLVDHVTTTTQLLLDDFGTVNVRDYSNKPGFMDKIGLSASTLADSPLAALLEMMTYQPLPDVQ